MTPRAALIEGLRKDSRLSISELGRKKSIPPTTLYSIMGRIEKGIIIKHVSMINWEKTGYKRFIFLIFETDNIMGLTEKIRENANTNNLYRTDSGLSAEMIFRNTAEFEEFIISLDREMIDYTYHPIEETIKQEESN